MGHRVVLSSLFSSSPHYFQQLYQDSMVKVRHFGKSSLFITFTAILKWLDVQNLLQEDGHGLTAADRPDFVPRVYYLKMKSVLADLQIHHVFYCWMGHCYHFEYQKRGFPHSHLLLSLLADDHFLDPATVDDIICPKFPHC